MSETVQKEKKPKEKKPLGREILEWVVTIVAAVAIALCIRTFIFEPVRVDGDSMNDTLVDGEIMITTKYDYLFSEPNRFDVVICHYPGRGNTNFVKRIVGVGGDVVEIREGYLYVNGEKYAEPYITNDYRVNWGSNGYSFGPYTVPEGMYFVMGDHRNNSNDSRAQGAISRDMIIGHVQQVVWPLNAFRSIPNGLNVQ